MSPLCHLLDCHIDHFIWRSIDTIAVEDLQPNTIAVEMIRKTITKESRSSLIVASQSPISHSNIIILTFRVCFGVDDLHGVAFG